MASCDNRCTSGKEGTCKCSCGGQNHGTAKKVWDVLQDGGTASVKGSGLDMDLQVSDDKGTVQVWQRGNKVQQYRSEEEFIKDLGKLIRANRVDVNATDADNRRQLDLKAGREIKNEPKLTDKEAFAQIRATGATVKKVDGEYVVNVPGGTEGTAYYTDDKADAVGTARVMMSDRRPLMREIREKSDFRKSLNKNESRALDIVASGQAIVPEVYSSRGLYKEYKTLEEKGLIKFPEMKTGVPLPHLTKKGENLLEEKERFEEADRKMGDKTP